MWIANEPPKAPRRHESSSTHTFGFVSPLYAMLLLLLLVLLVIMLLLLLLLLLPAERCQLGANAECIRCCSAGLKSFL